MHQKSKLFLLRLILLCVVILTSSGFDNKRSEKLIFLLIPLGSRSWLAIIKASKSIVM